MTLRIAVLADLGQDTYHSGDEAMGHAAAEELRSRGLQVLMLSRNPGQTKQLFGVDAAPTLAFPWPPAEREDYLRRIRGHLAGSAELPAGDPARELISELRKCDGLLIAGGGNLNSRYGWLLYERAAAVAVARALNKPVVVSGQTLGPQLSAADTMVLADLLRAAELTSVREQSSADLAVRIGAPAVRGLDDASFLSGGQTADLPKTGYVAVTVSPLAGSLENLYALLGAELDSLHRQTGQPAVFLPHVGIGDGDGWDMSAHARIAGSMTSPFRLMPVLTARETAELTAGASMIVTSRYHPAVFGLSRSVPVVGLAVDDYSAVRLQGVSANWGLEDFVLPLPGLPEGLLSAALAEVWERRAEISAHLSSVLPARTAWSNQWWDAVAAVFSGSPALSSPAPDLPPDLPPVPELRASGQWAAAAKRLGAGFYAQSALSARSEVEEDRVRSYLAQPSGELASLRDEHQRLLESRTVKTALSLYRIYAKLLRR
ncbi:polysaccharide pyruvyl transferase family protein [Arthrobacter sp. APC 3897]|uniref:polysaccharide pyruvyl transferase family protein n=1 Tax=Arthrobacter sp. APC 3897 TaxID=3035204 RepID=UPI0025B609C3|nr:polysaccharide pyruvyl transferase family protein [Arthrobacter sp. APC 3897]MDN3481461.1 polysaccharide pyruvyl transferase family protein [Arthrobacter sp. APC 3897]